MGRFWMMMGCLFAGLSVLCGAFAAHALRHNLPPESLEIFETATRYMMFHSMGLITLGLWSHWEKWAKSFWAGVCFSVGILLFCGSLYTMALTQAHWPAYLTPAGGIFFVLGWFNFIFSIFVTKNKFI